jgi:hypothetical protein
MRGRLPRKRDRASTKVVIFHPDMFGLQRGTVILVVGLMTLIGSIFLMKLSDNNFLWIGIALGAAIGMRGAISISHIAGE